MDDRGTRPERGATREAAYEPTRGGSREPSRDGEDRRRSTDGGRSSLSNRWVTIAGTILVFLGLFVALRTVDAGAVLHEVRRADPLLLAVAVGIYVVSWPVRGRRYAEILSVLGRRVGTAFCTRAVFVSQTANLALPARAGDATRAYVVSARDVPYASGFASLAVERVFDLAALAALGVLAGAAVAADGETAALSEATATGGARTAVLAAGVVTASTVGAGIVVVISAHQEFGVGAALRRRVAGHSRIERAFEGVLRFVADVQIVARRPDALVTVGGASVVAWGLDVLAAVCVLAALGSDLAPSTLVAVGTLAVCVGNLAKVLPLTQGGIGLYEAAFTALVVGLTPIGAPVALAAAIVDHAMKNAVTLAGGTASIASLGVSPFARTDEAPPAETNEGARDDDRQVFRRA